MTEKTTTLDIKQIFEYCNINGEDTSSIMSSIAKLEEQYSRDELVVIYNQMITEVKEPSLIIFLLKQIDKIRDISSLDILLDLLLLKSSFKESLEGTQEAISVRCLCAKAISNFKDTKAVLPLLYCLNNKEESYQLRLSCAEALGKIGDKYAVTPLIDVLTDETEKSVYLKESATKALGMLGDMRAIDPFIDILQAKKGLYDKFSFLKERILSVIGKFNFTGDKVFNAIKESLNDTSPIVRIGAIEALMNSDDDRAVPLIKRMLKDDDDEVIKNALIALYNIEGADILYEVLKEDEYSTYCKEVAHDLVIEYETDYEDDDNEEEQ